MTHGANMPAGGLSEAQISLRLKGLQHEVERSAVMARRLGLLAIILVLLLVALLICLHLYHVMQYATVSSIEASAVDGRSGAAEITYTPESAGKIEFVRESDGLVQTLTEYASAPGSSEKSKGNFTWSGKTGEKSSLKVTYRGGLFLVTKDLPLAKTGSR